MEIQGWFISAIIGVATYISIFVTMKNKTDQNSKELESDRLNFRDAFRDIHSELSQHNKEDDNLHSKIFEKLDKLNEEVAKHKVLLVSAPSMKDVDDKFVSKEMFKQMEKHIDDKLDTLERSIDKGFSQILVKLSKEVV